MVSAFGPRGRQPWCLARARSRDHAANSIRAVNTCVIGGVRGRERRHYARVIGPWSGIEDGPADVVPQPLVVKYELADRVRELAALPPALASRCGLTASLRRGGACGLDRICGGTELMRGDVCDGRSLCRGERGMACRPGEVPGRGVRMTGRGARLRHRDLASGPGTRQLDRATRSI